MTTTVIVVLIPNAMMMITLFDDDTERVEFVVQEERPKRKRIIGPIMSSDTNYDTFDTPILEECLESIIDKTLYTWTASTVSSGRCNAANIMPLRLYHKRECAIKKSPLTYGQTFLQMLLLQRF